MPNYPVSSHRTETVTISNGASLSTAIDLSLMPSPDGGFLRLFGIVIPASWTAASVSFQMSCDGGATFIDVYDTTGAELVLPAAASRFIALDPVIFAAIPMIKVRSGTAATPVNQAGDRVITLVTRNV